MEIEHRRLNVSELPGTVFGGRGVLWTGSFLYFVINGMLFASLWVGYFYLRTRETTWPPFPTGHPRWIFGLISLGIYLFALWPNGLTRRRAEHRALGAAGAALAIMLALGVLAVIDRVWEFHGLATQWHDSSYGSIIAGMLALHSAHLAAVWIETLVLFIALRTKQAETRVISITTNANYWLFVILFYLPTWFILYPLSHWI